MSVERKLLGRWHNGDLLPEEYMQLMKETKELLAQPETEQEPVAWIIETEIEGKLSEWICTDKKHYMDASDGKDPMPLYTAPPKREPLSDDEMRAIWKEGIRGEIPFVEIGRAIEKAHGIGVDDE